MAVARAFGVSQPWISRILNGKFGSRSSLVQDLCKRYRVQEYAHNVDTANLEAIEEKVLQLWDGTPEGHERLQNLLEALLALKSASPATSVAKAGLG